MPPGRNDPCPCGSGRKYKHCCGKPRSGGTGHGLLARLPAEALERARGAGTWQADLLAIPAVISGKERARMVAALVVAGDVVVGTDIQSVTSAEPEDVAGALEAAVAEAATGVGVWPATLIVRHGEVADLLRPLFRPRGCSVGVASVLDGLDPLAADLMLQFTGEDTWPAVSPPETWAAWGLPPGMVKSLFQAYATFYRAAPWRWFNNIPPIMVEWEDGTGPWTGSVMGAGMGEFGLAVYSEATDLETLVDAAEDDEDADFFEDADEDIGSSERWRGNPFRDLQGWVVHLGYLHRRELSRAMLKEISLSRWEVEAVAAYPHLMPVLTPGGGLQRELVRRLTELLHGVVALAGKYGSRLQAPEGGVFTWSDGGLTLRFFMPPVDLPSGGPLPPDLQEVLEEIGEGDYGSLEEVQAEMDRRMGELNARPQEELGGISPDQALALMNGGFDDESPLRLSEEVSPTELEGSGFLANARAFLSALVETDGTPATAAGNLKRVFVAEMVEGMRFEEGYLDDLFRMNKVINEEDVGPLHVLRVNLEVGGLLKLRKGRFVLSRKGKGLAKPEALGRLFAHLFRTYFGRFNIAYGSRGSGDPALQPAVPLLLWQIGVRAREWVSLRTLATQILPPRPDKPPPEGSSGWWEGESDLRWWVLRPLVRFGLLEERNIGEAESWRTPPEDVQFRTTPLFGALLRFEW